MKNLLYKEIKLSIHWLCYLFSVCFFWFALLPYYPSYIACLYVIITFPVLFLGVNKGQQNNDLLFTLTLPARKTDVVKARLLSMSLLEGLNLVTLIPSLFIRELLYQVPALEEGEEMIIGLGANQIFVYIGTILIGYAICDYIYVTWFYKTGKGVVGPSIVCPILFLILESILHIALPLLIPGLLESISITSGTVSVLLQIVFFIVSFGFYIILRLLASKKGAQNLERLNF